MYTLGSLIGLEQAPISRTSEFWKYWRLSFDSAQHIGEEGDMSMSRTSPDPSDYHARQSSGNSES